MSKPKIATNLHRDQLVAEAVIARYIQELSARIAVNGSTAAEE